MVRYETEPGASNPGLSTNTALKKVLPFLPTHDFQPALSFEILHLFNITWKFM
jgi:hypothetical protein